MEGKRIAIVDGDGGKLLDVVESSAIPGVFGIVALNPDGSDIVWGGGGAWDVTWPASSTDNAIARFDGTTWKTIQNSSASVDDNGTVSANAILLSSTPTVTGSVVGELYLNSAENGLPEIRINANSSLTVGAEMYALVVNKTGVQINDGQVVYVSGAQWNRPTASLALADASATSKVIGVATANIANNAEWFVTIVGHVRGYDTSGFTVWDTLYLSATTPGALTNVAPASPHFVVEVAKALNSTINGLISVRTQIAIAGNTSLWTDNTVPPSQNAVKTYVDAGLWNKVAKAWDTMTGALDLPSANITGTAGAWYLTLVGQSANPAAPAAGTLLLHASTNNGFTRMEQDNEAGTNLVYGRDNAFIAKNTSGLTINKGQVVYVTGSTGNVPNVSLAQANASGTIPTIAIAADPIANNAFGQIMYAGILTGIDTSAFSSGDKLFVSPTVAGWLTNVRPSGTTNFVQRVGTVLVSGVGNGSIQILIAPAVLNMETGTNAATWTGRAVVGDSFNGVALTTAWGWTNFLADDGTYKAASGSSAPDVIATRSLI